MHRLGRYSALLIGALFFAFAIERSIELGQVILYVRSETFFSALDLAHTALPALIAIMSFSFALIIVKISFTNKADKQYFFYLRFPRLFDTNRYIFWSIVVSLWIAGSLTTFFIIDNSNLTKILPASAVGLEFLFSGLVPILIFFKYHRMPSAFFFRPFSEDKPVRSIFRESAKEARRNGRIRLAAVANPRGVRWWQGVSSVFVPFYSLRLFWRLFADQRAGKDWPVRIWRSLGDARFVVFYLANSTAYLELELRLVLRAVGCDRVLLVVDDPSSIQYWKEKLGQIAGISDLEIRKLTFIAYDGNKEGRARYREQFRQFVRRIPESAAGLNADAMPIVEKYLPSIMYRFRSAFANVLALILCILFFTVIYLGHLEIWDVADSSKLRGWYEEAAAAGEADAMLELGYLYNQGDGVARDYAKAREWYEKAAAAGNAVAMNNLGYLYRQGNGVAQDYAKAREWYEKAVAAGNTVAMNNLSDLQWAYDKAGVLFKEQNNLAAALKAYEDSLAIAERLAKADPDSMDRQLDLAWSYNNVGDVLTAQDKLKEALLSYGVSLAISKALVARDSNNTRWQGALDHSVDYIGSLAYLFVLDGDFERGLLAADGAIAFAPDKIWLHTNRAHALMFLGRVDDARALYLRYRGTKNVNEEKPWEATILDDFAALRKANLNHPLMDEITELYGAEATEPGTEQPEQAAR